MAKPTYYPAGNMKDVAYWNKYIGHNFFDKDTMEFWGSKIESGLYQNNTFITSEDNWNRTERGYTVRQYDPNTAHINDVSGFLAFKTRAEAKAFALAYKEDTE